MEDSGEVVPINPDTDDDTILEESDVMPVNPVYSRQEIVEKAYEHFDKEGFVTDVPVYAGMQEINKLANMPVDDMPQSVLCHRIADKYHPQRYDLHSFNKKSPNKVLKEEPERFKNCLDKEIELRGIIPTSGKLGIAFKAHGIAAIYNFRPGLALHYFKKYLQPGGLILDTSMGFGGRLVAAMCYKDCRYIGIDHAIEQFNGNAKMASDYGYNNAYLINGCAESDEVREKVEEFFGKVDFCFTSPPYFNKEKYARDDDPSFTNQSSQKYKQYDSWVRNFLKPIMKLQFDALAKGRFSVINIDKVTTDGVYPISNDTVRIGQEVGFEYVKADYHRFGSASLMPKSENIDDDAQEGFFIFQKP